MATIYYTASSLDGFIATEDHSLDWLLTRQMDRSGPMNFDDFRARIGVGAMGASTWQWLLDHEPDGWDDSLPCWVFTHRDFAPAKGVTFTQADVREVHREMTEVAAGKDIWLVGGGDLVGQFADHGLLDEVWVQQAPVTLGSGAPLLPRRLELRREELAENGELACGRYSVVRG